MPKRKIVAAFTVRFFESHPPEVEMRETVVNISEELFSKTLEQIRGERNRIRVKVSNRQRLEERLRVQEELSNG